MASRGSADSAALAAVLLVLTIGGFATYKDLFQALPSADTIPFREIVSLATDAAGYGQTHVIAEFQSVASMGHITFVATVAITESFPADLQLTANLSVQGIQLTIPIPNMFRGKDSIIFTWDIPIPTPIPGPIPLKSDVVLSVVNCGQCADLTFNFPVDIVVTMRA